ncbi:MAG: hypothetical protein FJ147_25630 [Deltaproteobacteria bacterium]|nr:hypothetical protein [Deltaproteobacteria bacterium]
MLFLIEYDRPSGRIVTFRKFVSSEQRKAEEARLELELALHHDGIEHEVVILEAVSEEVLRRTHGRYFEDFAGLVDSLAQEQQSGFTLSSSRQN